ncbi:MAG: hypothetical protein IRZ03_18035 [Acidobacterium ailaaui]|nr:hypothetical protein [Pseudacidobacterium ailaaui]
MSLAQARERQFADLKKLDAGIDPMAERRAETRRNLGSLAPAVVHRRMHPFADVGAGRRTGRSADYKVIDQGCCRCKWTAGGRWYAAVWPIGRAAADPRTAWLAVLACVSLWTTACSGGGSGNVGGSVPVLSGTYMMIITGENPNFTPVTAGYVSNPTTSSATVQVTVN